jgi:putative aminopeptidase FrvX
MTRPRPPRIPPELAGLIGILLDRMVADALAQQRDEQHRAVQVGAPAMAEQPIPTLTSMGIDSKAADSRAPPARAAEQRR